MIKEKLKSTKVFIIVHIIVYLLLLYPLVKGLRNIFTPIFIGFCVVSFIWRIKLLQAENKLLINNIIGAVIVYGFAFYMIWKIFISV